MDEEMKAGAKSTAKGSATGTGAENALQGGATMPGATDPAPKKRGRPKAPPKPKKEKIEQKPPNHYARKRAVEYAESVAKRVDEKDKATIISALTLPEEDMPDAALRRKTDRTKYLPTKVWTPENDEERAFVSQILRELLTEFRKPTVKDDDEMAERISDYYDRCANEGRTPVWEEVCLSLGYGLQRVNAIIHGTERGFTEITPEILKKAKDFQQSFDAKLVVAGKMNFLAYCFRAKCYYGMRDNAELPETTRNPMGEANLTPKQLRERYLQGMRESDYEDKTTE